MDNTLPHSHHIPVCLFSRLTAAIVFGLAMLLSFDGMAQFAGGSGTAADPYQVANVLQLQAIKNAPNNAHIILVNDIDASATAGWNGGQGFDPIGWFNGTINGNGYSINNLVINRPGSNQAAFITQSGPACVVNNIGFSNITVVGGAMAAAISGASSGTVDQVTVSGSISGSTNVGGLVGQNYTNGKIVRATFSGSVNGSNNSVGGITGYNNSGLIDDCLVSGSVSGNNEVGGIAGLNEGMIQNSETSVTVSGNATVGGIAGLVNGGQIEGSISGGTVNGSTEVGGMVGFLGWTAAAYIKMSYSTADVNCSGNEAGGLVGITQGSLIENSFALGSVSGNNRVGGLVGQLLWGSNIVNCFSAGQVTGSGGQTGGLVGRNQGGNATNSFWDTETSGYTSSDVGNGLSTAEMKTQSSFTNWDFTNVWGMNPAINDGYPYLQIFVDDDPDEYTWTGAVSTAWEHAGNWTMNDVPLPGDEVSIPNAANQPVISSDVTIQGIHILSGSSLTVGESGSLTVTGSLSNESGAAGLVVASGPGGTGSLIYNAAVEGTFERYVGSTERWQMLSSPVSNQSISGSFTPSGTYGDGTGYDFYAWNEPDTMWMYLLEPAWPFGSSFNVGQGYLVSYQQPGTKAFTGNFNHGSISMGVSRTMGESDYFGTNLLGNPYPSSIDWKAAAWDRSALKSTGGGHDVYIWNDGSNNYGVYNSASGSDSGTLGVGRYIAPTQGFFVLADYTGSISLDNSVRVHQGAGNWLKSGQAGNTDSDRRLVLRLESADNLGNDEVALEFGHPKEMGSPKLFSFIETAPSLYLPKGTTDFSIRMLPSAGDHPVVPVSFTAGADGQYRLRASFHDQLSDMVVLQDLQTGERHDFLSEGDYVFFATTADKPERFVLRFREGNYANPHARLPVSAYAFQNTLAIDLRLIDAGNSCQVEVFDVLGRRVFENSLTGSTLYELPLSLQGAFVVQISTPDAAWNGKVFFIQ